MHVRDDAALGAEVAGGNLHCHERPLLERAHVRVGPTRRVGVVAVIGRVAASEVLVDAGAGEAVEAVDRGLQRACVHADCPSQLGECRPCRQMPAALIFLTARGSMAYERR